jgi:hypothetical protein
MTIDQWLYFGCRSGAGHYLINVRGNSLGSDKIIRRLEAMDGKLAPQPEPASAQQCYVAAFSRLGGFNLSTLSWWDRSVDTRSGSNSTLFAPGLDISAEEMLVHGQKLFPWVFSRLPQPLKLQSENAA